MNVNFYTLSKRENSTAIPTGSGTQFSVILKDDCSIIEPTLQISKPAATNWSTILSFNYVYIQDFGRYYFVRDNVFLTNNILEFHLEIDALASWKSTIGASSEYILRSASDYDGDIIDSLYPTKTEISVSQGSNIKVFSTTDITYIIGVINNTTTSKYGAVKYYAMTSAQLGSLMSFLLGNNIISDTQTFIAGFSTEIQNGIARSLMKPTDYIVESFALPYTPSVGAAETVTIGWWSTDIVASPVLSNYFQTNIKSLTSMSLPSHPMAASRGHYLSSSPYTRYWLSLGPFGIYPVDAAEYINSPSLSFSVDGDQFGNVSCTIFLDGKIKDILYANVKCNFPIAQVSIDAMNVANSAVNAVVSSSGLGDSFKSDIVGSTAGVATGILNGISSLMPQVQHQGTQGSFLNVFKDFYSNAEFFIPVDDDNTHRGRPLCQVKTINTLSGYILVADPDISIPGTAEENTRIKNYMASGFYYE